ncbi:MAG TPA: hypothetical protein VLA46_11425 [Saprospiraceae bacterium]|nr:hypothetical protein [Saprospiraceae bacterium]
MNAIFCSYQLVAVAILRKQLTNVSNLYPDNHPLVQLSRLECHMWLVSFGCRSYFAKATAERVESVS